MKSKRVGRKKTAAADPPKYVSLSEFLLKTGTTHERLAKRLSISRSYVTLIARGDRQPSLDLAVKIEAETGVPAASMISQAVA